MGKIIIYISAVCAVRLFILGLFVLADIVRTRFARLGEQLEQPDLTSVSFRTQMGGMVGGHEV